MKQYDAPKSFSGSIPEWIEFEEPDLFFDYFKEKLQTEDDVMMIYEVVSETWLTRMKEFCKQQEWKCVSHKSIKGIEASVVIIYDFKTFYFESFTRAKNQLIIATNRKTHR